jgi:hypothetical protein
MSLSKLNFDQKLDLQVIQTTMDKVKGKGAADSKEQMRQMTLQSQLQYGDLVKKWIKFTSVEVPVDCIEGAGKIPCLHCCCFASQSHEKQGLLFLFCHLWWSVEDLFSFGTGPASIKITIYVYGKNRYSII